MASVAGRSTNKVSELDTEGIRSGAFGTQLEIFTFLSNNFVIELHILIILIYIYFTKRVIIEILFQGDSYPIG